MPELSSIIREPFQPINPEKEAVDSHAPQVVSAESEFYKRIYENPDAFSIFEMTLAFDMPAFDLPEIQGIPSNKDPLRRRMRKVYGLGSGVSCSLIQHQTDTGTEAVCPTGTLVALKRYTSIPSGFPGEQNANKKLRTLLFQELQVFCHPYLKEHENICKLLFIGWETTTIVPTLALELASYGTLDDCMQLLRSYGSVIRKAHLSLDVALGIEALHACSLVHGDIKPSNIIVQKHPTRTIVAKLTDFNGVSPANTYGSSTYSFGTPSWQPPEVLLNEESIDWQLGDVYSYGMVFATIWCKTGFIPVGGSFLDPVCKYELDRDAKRSMLELYKYTPDDEDDSLIKLALCSAAVEEQELAFSPASVITCTLSTLPTRRRPLSMILSSHFVEFSKRTNRKIPSPVARNLALSDEVEHQEQSARSAWMINGSFLNRSKPFKENVFQALLSSASKFRNEITLPKQALGLEKGIDVTDEELLDLLRHVDRELKSAIWRDENLHHFSNQALEVALAYTLGIGTSIDEEHALEWMSLAASSGNGWAIYVFGPLEQSTAKAQNCLAPRKLWCCQGVFAGYMQTAACLNDLDPELNKIAMRMHRRRYWGRTQPQIVKIEPYLPIFIERIKEDHTLVDIAAPSRRGHTDIKETALHLCAATGDIESTRYLVLNAGANVNATNERNETPVFYATRAGQFEVTKFLCSQGAMVDQISTEGFAITHCLALMDDEQAAELAPLFFEKNARIDIATEERAGDRTDRLTLGSGIPLRWAALKNQPKLFAAFLRLHSLPEQKISFVEFYHLVVVLASLNLHEMLNLVIESEADIVDLTLQPPASEEARDIESILTSMSLVSKTTVKEKLSPLSLSEIHYTSLLYEALDSRKPTLFTRRYIHRTEFRKAKDKTVALLLRLGADPIAPVHRAASGTNEGEEDDSLTLSVYTGDTASFMLFLEFMSEKKINVLPFLENQKRYGGYSALQRSIYSDSREIFMYLIEHFPTLLDSVGEHDRRPLHSAAVMTWPGYTKELLRRGVSRNVRARDGATPFTWALMRNPNIEIADILAEGVDMTEILGPCPGPQSTFTAFGKLLSGITHYKMGFGVDRLQYLVKKFGPPSFFLDAASQTTVFRTTLMLRPLPTDQSQTALQMIVLKLLLELFPHKIDFLDWTGRAAIHYAIMYCNLPATRLLIGKGANANLEIGQVGATIDEQDIPSPLRGYRPLDLAVKIRGEGPKDDVLYGGQREIEQWEENMQDIIKVLLQNGAGEPGTGVRLYDSLSTSIAAGTLERVYVGSSKSLTIDFLNSRAKELQLGDARISDRSRGGGWPERLPWEEEPKVFNIEGFSQKGNSAVEVIDVSGLTVRMPHESLRILQDLLGAISPSILTGSNVENRPPPPEAFLEELRSQIVKVLRLRNILRIRDSLPAGWEVRTIDNGTLYYVDHNSKTTTWQQPAA